VDSIEDISHNASLSPDHTSIISLEISGFILDGFYCLPSRKRKNKFIEEKCWSNTQFSIQRKTVLQF
jgi:hypothetical protein